MMQAWINCGTYRRIALALSIVATTWVLPARSLLARTMEGTPTSHAAPAPDAVNLGAGIIATYAGGLSGGGLPTGYAMAPNDVELAGAGYLLIADTAHDVVWLANLTADDATLFDQTIAAGSMAVVAGNATAGFTGDNGPATAAALNIPAGLAVDGRTGNLYIVDTYNNRIREVSSTTHVITTVAGGGTGCAGQVDTLGDGCAATQATLGSPTGVVVDGAGNLYIADTENNRVREVAAGSETISTVAGTGSVGYSGDGELATQAALSHPSGVAVDGAGNLYIADTYNNRIREVNSSQVITTEAGTGALGDGGDGGPAFQAMLALPAGVRVDSQGNLYIADTYNNRVREVVSSSGVITTVAGTGAPGFNGDGGAPEQATLSSPTGVVVDGAGNLYIADTENNRVREVVAGSDTISTVAGTGSVGYSGDGGPATQAALSHPAGVAVDSQGNLYFSDQYDQGVREVFGSTGAITTVAGTGIAGFGGDSGPAAQATLNFPVGVAVDSAGNVFIADRDNNRIREVLSGSRIITTVAGTGAPDFSGDDGAASEATLSMPHGLAVDSHGDLFIADTYNQRVREILSGSNIITTVAGTGSAGYSGDSGPASLAQLDMPLGVAVDAADNLYIADSVNQRIRKVNLNSKTITTIAGDGVEGYSGDGGPATSASLQLPSGVAVDGSGDIYVADGLNHVVRMVDATTGFISTIAGNGTAGFGGDGGPAVDATFGNLGNVAVDATNDVFIADYTNNRVRVVGSGANPPPPTATTTPSEASTPTPSDTAAPPSTPTSTPTPSGTVAPASTPTSTPTPTGGLTIVGSGTVDAQDGGVITGAVPSGESIDVSFPPGAVPAGQTLTVTLAAFNIPPSPPPDGDNVVGLDFDLSAVDSANTPVSQFTAPVTISFDCPASGDPSLMKFAFYDTTQSAWVPLSVTNPGQCPLQATTTHFTAFSVVALPSPAYCTDASHTDAFRGTGDINGDGTIDLTDFSTFAGDYGKSGTLFSPYSDMNCDGSANLTDFSVFATYYGR
jgi:uridylate kinase